MIDINGGCGQSTFADRAARQVRQKILASLYSLTRTCTCYFLIIIVSNVITYLCKLAQICTDSGNVITWTFNDFSRKQETFLCVVSITVLIIRSESKLYIIDINSVAQS